MPASTVPSDLRITNGRAGSDGVDVFAEAIRMTMYHRNLTFYENLDVI
jgi:hypothetical protein